MTGLSSLWSSERERRGATYELRGRRGGNCAGGGEKEKRPVYIYNEGNGIGKKNFLVRGTICLFSREEGEEKNEKKPLPRQYKKRRVISGGVFPRGSFRGEEECITCSGLKTAVHSSWGDRVLKKKRASRGKGKRNMLFDREGYPPRSRPVSGGGGGFLVLLVGKGVLAGGRERKRNYYFFNRTEEAVDNLRCGSYEIALRRVFLRGEGGVGADPGKDC